MKYISSAATLFVYLQVKLEDALRNICIYVPPNINKLGKSHNVPRAKLLQPLHERIKYSLRMVADCGLRGLERKPEEISDYLSIFDPLLHGRYSKV